LPSKEFLNRFGEKVLKWKSQLDRNLTELHEMFDEISKDAFGKFVGNIMSKIENDEQFLLVEKEYLILLLKIENNRMLLDSIIQERAKDF